MSTLSVNFTVTPNQAKKSIIKCINKSRPIFIWGPAGIGKSEIVEQIAKSENRQLIDIRLNLWEPSDIRGIPYYDPSLNTMKWAPPNEFPTDPNSTALIFLDEFNSAAPATQAAAYQLILNRRVGEYRLPEGVRLIAAGNRDGDKGITHRMPAPLANRFVHIEVRKDFDDWYEWAVKNNIHPDVIGYLTHKKEHLHMFDPASSSRSFPTPRSWSFVSDLLQDDNIEESTVHDLVAGSVGYGVATEFMAHRRHSSMLPKPMDVLHGKVKKLTVKEISAKYTLAESLSYELHIANQKDDPKWNEYAENFLEFLMENYQAELIVLTMRNSIRNYCLPFDTDSKAYEKFCENFAKHATAAQNFLN